MSENELQSTAAPDDPPPSNTGIIAAAGEWLTLMMLPVLLVGALVGLTVSVAIPWVLLGAALQGGWHLLVLLAVPAVGVLAALMLWAVPQRALGILVGAATVAVCVVPLWTEGGRGFASDAWAEAKAATPFVPEYCPPYSTPCAEE